MKKRDIKLITVSTVLFTVGVFMGLGEGSTVIPNIIGLTMLYLSHYIFEQTTIYRKEVK